MSNSVPWKEESLAIALLLIVASFIGWEYNSRLTPSSGPVQEPLWSENYREEWQRIPIRQETTGEEWMEADQQPALSHEELTSGCYLLSPVSRDFTEPGSDLHNYLSEGKYVVVNRFGAIVRVR